MSEMPISARGEGRGAVRPLWFAAVAVVFLAASAFQVFFGFYFFGQDSFAYGNDDAFISYRYSRNLVEHGVLSFNATDLPPVEGFSNPLHVALGALLILVFGPFGIYPAMAMLGALAVLGAISLVARHVTTETDAQTGLLAALILALLPAYWIHATSGLETAFVLLFQVLLWITAARLGSDEEEPNRATLAIACLATAVLAGLRTDGFVLPVIVAVWLALRGRALGAGLIVLVAATVFFGQMAARYAYFGLPMPLPTYVKVGGGLIERLLFAGRLYASIALYGGLMLPFLAVAYLSVRALSRLRDGLPALRSAVPLDVWIFGGITAYYFVIGGDIYRDRFLLILFATGTAAALRLAHGLAPGRLPAAYCALAVTLQVVLGLNFDKRLVYIIEFPKYDRAVTIGKYLADTFPGGTLATSTAGKPPYYSGLETIDMLGLNDRHIAFTEPHSDVPGHSKWDAAYVLSRRPDVICSHVHTDGDLAWGMRRSVYAPEGYGLSVLVRNRTVEGEDLLNVEGKTREEIRALVAAGYEYGCLDRQAPVAE